MILNLVRLGKKSATHSKSKFPFKLAQGRAFRYWAMRHSFNYQRAFFNFLQVFILVGWCAIFWRLAGLCRYLDLADILFCWTFIL
jgi:hypothetical protein